jgi:hypothetical protein
MTELVTTSSASFNIAKYHIGEVENSLNFIEKINSREYKIKEIMEVSLRIERAIMKLKQLQSELTIEISNA